MKVKLALNVFKMALGIIAVLFILSNATQTIANPTRFKRVAKPELNIKHMPTVPPGENSWGTISGTASGVNENKTHVVVYSLGAGIWYVQPYTMSFSTPISHGTWTTYTHGGEEFAALLVIGDYKAPATLDSLPNIGGQILAIAHGAPHK